MNNELMENKNYSMQDLMNLMGQSAKTVNVLAGSVMDLQRDVKSVSDKVLSVEDSVTSIKQDITDIKENEEITYSQQENIKNAVRNRVYTLLELPEKKSDWEVSDRVVSKKYGKLFFNRCYSEVQQLGHLRQPYRMTAKKDYDAAMSEIEAWRPKDGVEGLKREADDIATANKIAREQGYTSRKR